MTKNEETKDPTLYHGVDEDGSGFVTVVGSAFHRDALAREAAKEATSGNVRKERSTRKGAGVSPAGQARSEAAEPGAEEADS